MAKSGLFLGLVFLIASATCGSAQEGIGVMMNQATVLKLPRNADTVIVGNPDIADASVQDATTLVLTGKGFGVTNLVVLDASGTPILDDQVTVSRSTVSTVRIYRRASIQTLSCTPFCEGAYRTSAERRSENQMGDQ
jgi:Flp pilus assembly secretin CpaC